MASWQDGERGAVLTLVRRTDGSLHALVVAATRAEPAGWDIDAFAQSPWITDERGRFSGAGPAVAGRMHLARLTMVPGAVPAGLAGVRVDSAGVAAADPATGAFLAIVAGEDPDAITLVAVDGGGAERGEPLLVPAP